MAIVVDGEQYRKLDGQLGEIKRQLRQKGGYPFDPVALGFALQAIVEGNGISGFPSAILAAAYIPDWLKVVEDAPPREFRVEDLEFISFLRGDEKYLVGTDLRTRAVELNGDFSLGDGVKMVKDPDKLNAVVPAGVNWIPLTRTVLRSSDGYLNFACLYRGGNGRWNVNFYRFSHDWGSGSRLPRSASRPPLSSRRRTGRP